MHACGVRPRTGDPPVQPPAPGISACVQPRQCQDQDGMAACSVRFRFKLRVRFRVGISTHQGSMHARRGSLMLRVMCSQVGACVQPLASPHKRMRAAPFAPGISACMQPHAPGTPRFCSPDQFQCVCHPTLQIPACMHSSGRRAAAGSRVECAWAAQPQVPACMHSIGHMTAAG